MEVVGTCEQLRGTAFCPQPAIPFTSNSIGHDCQDLAGALCLEALST